MQDGALDSHVDGQGISRATGKDAEHGSRSGGYKTRRGKKGINNPKNQECLYWPLGAECGNTNKGNLVGVGGGRRKI